VGGAVQLHETAAEAVVREVIEETGVHYEIDRLAFIHENYFLGLGGDPTLRCHEVALYFLMKSRGCQELYDTGCVYGNVREHMVWLPIDQLNDFKLYPLFFKSRLMQLQDSIVHIVSNEYDRHPTSR